MAGKSQKQGKRDLYQEVTDKVLALMEEGGQFEMPWHSLGHSFPTNPVTGRRYRGANIFLLGGEAMKQGYATGEWATFKQWQQKGAQVKKGEKGTTVVFFKPLKKEEEDSKTGEVQEVVIPLLKHFTVFNADQVDGYEPTTTADLLPEVERIEAAEAFVASTGADIRFGGDSAYYQRAFDYIGVPELAQFTATAQSSATENFYSVLLHELTHWTGAPHRLDRDKGGSFGDQDYAFEELIAEMGAAFACAHLGISSEPRPDHAHYLNAWKKKLQDDKKAVVKAATKAQQALDFLVQCQGEAVGSDDGAEPEETVKAAG